MKMPESDNKNPKVGGTSMASKNSNGADCPKTDMNGIKAMNKASNSKGSVNKSVTSTKESHIGGVNMGK